eukprot:SAG11_NODE_2538_length_3243_cov_1.535623_1_plen_63_part_00
MISDGGIFARHQESQMCVRELEVSIDGLERIQKNTMIVTMPTYTQSTTTGGTELGTPTITMS